MKMGFGDSDTIDFFGMIIVIDNVGGIVVLSSYKD